MLMLMSNYDLSPEAQAYLMSGPARRQREWESFLERLDEKAKIHGTRGATLRYLLKMEEYAEDIGLFCFMNGLDISFEQKLSEIAQEP